MGDMKFIVTTKGFMAFFIMQYVFGQYQQTREDF